MKKVSATFCDLLLLVGLMFVTDACNKKTAVPAVPPHTDTVSEKTQPALTGRFIFHSYSCYSCNDSKLYLYDFSAGTLTLLGGNWDITNAMNAHFSPDGQRIVFMGNKTGTTNWDVFIWRIGAELQPTDLTSMFGAVRDEDPKFSNDGNRVVFKQNGKMKEMDTLGNILHGFTVLQTEASVPYYTKGDSMILYSANEVTGTTADIYKFSIAANNIQPLSALPGIEEYYPIVRDDTSFLLTRWNNSGNQNDQVYMGYLDGRPTLRLQFNEADQNYSDAFPVGDKYVIVSSTRPGGKGGYDLYIADIATANRWSLSLYNGGINSVNNELGACYSER